MKIPVNNPAAVKIITVTLGAITLFVSAYAPGLAGLLHVLGSLLIGGGAVSVVRKP